MRLIAVDTATEACSAALWQDGEVLARFALAPREHTRLILPMIDALLAEAGMQRQQLDVVAFGRGPGSFTGLRIAAGIAQGLALAHDLPVVPVSSLVALAQTAAREHGCERVMAAIDARMQEVYWCLCQVDDGLMQAVSVERVTAPDAVEMPVQGEWDAAGSGWDTYADVLVPFAGEALRRRYSGVLPHAADIARLAVRDHANGLAVDAAQALPVYLRNQVVSKRSSISS